MCDRFLNDHVFDGIDVIVGGSALDNYELVFVIGCIEVKPIFSPRRTDLEKLIWRTVRVGFERNCESARK